MEEFKPRKRIPANTARAMYATAIIYDLLGIIPIVEWVIAFIAPITFYIWFKSCGSSYVTGKKAVRMLATFIFSIIPIIGELPGEQTLNVHLNILETQREDKEYNDKNQAQIQEAQRKKQAEINYMRMVEMKRAREEAEATEVGDYEEAS